MTMALYYGPAILVIRLYSRQEVRRSCGEWWRRGMRGKGGSTRMGMDQRWWGGGGVITAAAQLLVLVAIKPWSKGLAEVYEGGGLSESFKAWALHKPSSCCCFVQEWFFCWTRFSNDENLPADRARSIFGGYWHICRGAKTHNWQFHIGIVRKKTPWRPQPLLYSPISLFPKRKTFNFHFPFHKWWMCQGVERNAWAIVTYLSLRRGTGWKIEQPVRNS